VAELNYYEVQNFANFYIVFTHSILKFDSLLSFFVVSKYLEKHTVLKSLSYEPSSIINMQQLHGWFFMINGNNSHKSCKWYIGKLKLTNCTSLELLHQMGQHLR